MSTLILETLPILDLDHPGSNDQEYRIRRAIIAKAAIDFHREKRLKRREGDKKATKGSKETRESNKGTREGHKYASEGNKEAKKSDEHIEEYNEVEHDKEQQIPTITYTTEEHQTWEIINKTLTPLHQKWACEIYLEGRKKVTIDPHRIPQLQDLNQILKLFNFRLEPVHGLVLPRIFLQEVGNGTMLCTQYIRHPSNPFFTPEPDVVHEILGHVPMFTSQEVNELQIIIGKAANKATEQQLTALNRLYWYSIEYGLIEEQGEIKAFGAGLLGGIKDLTNAMTGQCIIKPFTIKEVIATDYNYSFEQPHFFVIQSLPMLVENVKNFIKEWKLGNEK